MSERIATGNGDGESHAVIDRLQELNRKATQLLTFLSFAIVAAILLQTNKMGFLTPCEEVAARYSLRFWVMSLFPILAIVLPIHELVGSDRARRVKIVLLWVAVLLVISGATAFLCAVW
jgi:hypothetical protein